MSQLAYGVNLTLSWYDSATGFAVYKVLLALCAVCSGALYLPSSLGKSGSCLGTAGLVPVCV